MTAITTHIWAQKLRVNDTLPGEGHFAAELGVSREVMREAFGSLAALKLIEVANGRKPRVAAIDGSVIAASLDHANAESAELLALVEAMGASPDALDDTTQHDIAFHQLIAQASRTSLSARSFPPSPPDGTGGAHRPRLPPLISPPA